ncbi:hypothetical protein DYB32_003944 [Aphanomyces invadans]|uniref:COP9 signalosome complex subunit 3 n=1 Tax=Aphanomyces invadans TaxID=157072 RepID=A0A418AYZ2_9STRA|nr:hypothetical protein DYB32_003944 [Aphanomyces invadans]
MASLTDFILTNCKKSGTALECSDLWKEVSTASVDDLDHALECLNAIDYAAAMAYLLLVKGKKLIKLQRQDRTGDSNADDGDVDMAVQADGNDDRNAKLSFLHQVISYLGDIVGVPEEAPDATRCAYFHDQTRGFLTLAAVSDLVQLAVQVAIAIHETIRLVYPLRQLLQKWRSSELSRQNALTPPQAAVQSIHVLEYFYYGGMVYTGLKQFRAAATFFLMIRVQKLPQVYTTVSLTKVAAEIHATISDAEACMLDVIEAGAITAAIDKQQDMVQLNPPSFDETNLHASIEHAIAFTTRLHEIDALLTMHPKYIGRTKDKRGAKFATDDAAGGSWMAQQVSG